MIDAMIYSSALEITRQPMACNNGHYVGMVRVNDLSEIDEGFEILASCEQGGDLYSLLTIEGRAKHDLAYPRLIIEVPASNFMGVERPAYTYQAPERFGGFA